MAKNKNKQLYNLRIKANLSFRELSEKTGLCFSTVCSIEAGKRNLNINVAKKLSEFYNVSLDYLYGLSFKDRLDKFINDLKRDYTDITFDKDKDAIFSITDELNEHELTMLKSILELSTLKDELLVQAFGYLNQLATKQHLKDKKVNYDDFNFPDPKK